jgi:hypothetical protein
VRKYMNHIDYYGRGTDAAYKRLVEAAKESNRERIIEIAVDLFQDVKYELLGFAYFDAEYSKNPRPYRLIIMVLKELLAQRGLR